MRGAAGGKFHEKIALGRLAQPNQRAVREQRNIIVGDQKNGLAWNVWMWVV